MARIKERKRKLILVSVTFALCLTIMLSGTFAWKSISQTAKNEAMGGIRNPGGRLHDDFNGSNKDIYVENFTKENEGQPIIVRIRLFEHMEIGENAGNTSNREGVKVLTRDVNNNPSEIDDVSTWHLHKYGEETATEENPHTYWTWKMGGQTTYMPTFNKNKDSLSADINGTYEGKTVGDNAHYDDYDTYTIGETVSDYEIYDADDNDIDEEKLSEERGEQLNIEGTNYTKSADKIEHTAKTTLDGEVISMAEWITEKDGALGNYWVYDTDGWAYWANPLEEEKTTGLLLDKITLGEINKRWYYGIYVECQMVTAEEIANVATAKAEKTGFYHEHEAEADGSCKDNECPGSTAQSLLSKIVEKIGHVEVENAAYEAYLADLTEEELQMMLNQEEETEKVEEKTEPKQTDLEDLMKSEETEDKEDNEDEDADGEQEPEDGTDTDTPKDDENTDTEPEKSDTPSDVTTGDGTTEDSTTGDGETGDGTTGDGTTGDGATGDETTGDSTTGDGVTGDETIGDSTTADGTTGEDTTKTDNAESTSADLKTTETTKTAGDTTNKTEPVN